MADKIVVSKQEGQTFTVSGKGIIVGIYYDGKFYWGSYKKDKRTNAVVSSGISGRDTIIKWAKNIIKSYGVK